MEQTDSNFHSVNPFSICYFHVTDRNEQMNFWRYDFFRMRIMKKCCSQNSINDIHTSK